MRESDQVWYAAYGSNMHASRLRCYLAGGTPEGGRSALPGCRDTSPPDRAEEAVLPGILYFATRSPVWSGGRAFYDPDGPGETAVHLYLLTAAQFCDIVAQEMYRAPGTDLNLSDVVEAGRAELGPGRYETLLCTGNRAGHPVLTCTAPWHYRDLPGTAPSAAYLRHLAAGIAEAHGWAAAEIAEYLATRPGAAGAWTPAEITALL